MNEANDRKEFDCQDVAALMSGLIDDVLTPDERHLAERHLASCRNCTHLLDEAESLDVLLTESSAVCNSIPEGFEQAVLAMTTGVRPMRSVRWRLFAGAGWLAAASITLAFIFANNGVDPAVGDGNGDSGSIAALSPLNGNDASRSVASRESTTSIPSYPLSAVQRSAVNEHYRPTRTVADSTAKAVSAQPAVTDQPNVVELNRGANWLITPGIDSFISRDAMSTERLGTPAPAVLMSRQDADVLFSVSYLLEALQYEVKEGSLGTADEIRREIEYDAVLDRLAATRERLMPQDRTTILAAESVLYRITYGPVNLQDLREIREDIRAMRLVDTINAMIGKIDPERAM